jgi:hypothetical protein
LEEFAGALQVFGFQLRRHEYRGFALTALWYRLTIYNPLARRAGQSVVVGDSPTRVGRAVRHLIYLGMKGYMSFDRLFRHKSGGMGIDALFEFVPPK